MGSYEDAAFASLLPYVTAGDNYPFPWTVERPNGPEHFGIRAGNQRLLTGAPGDEAGCQAFIELAGAEPRSDVPLECLLTLIAVAVAASVGDPLPPQLLPWVLDGDDCPPGLYRLVSRCRTEVEIATGLSFLVGDRLLQQAAGVYDLIRPLLLEPL